MSAARARLQAIAEVAAEDVAPAIADCARDDQPDLIVLGTLGLDAVGRLGSVSEAVMRRVGTPVLR